MAASATWSKGRSQSSLEPLHSVTGPASTRSVAALETRTTATMPMAAAPASAAPRFSLVCLACFSFALARAETSGTGGKRASRISDVP